MLQFGRILGSLLPLMFLDSFATSAKPVVAEIVENDVSGTKDISNFIADAGVNVLGKKIK